MKRLLLIAALALLPPHVAVAQTSTPISCTDATNTNCTVKKNQPFQLTADPALTTDAMLTESFRLYLDGVKQVDVVNTGAAPVFTFASGLSVAGDHTLFLEAIATVYDAAGLPQEISSGPSNVLTMHVVTGSLSAPKNVHIIR